MNTTPQIYTTAFAEDVLEGLIAKKKHLSSKYFYDDNGSHIFQQIMKMPEYYPTNCEFEILSEQSEQILERLEFKGKFNIVEFGSGDGTKTKQLLQAFLNKNADFTYMPIDISEEAILILEENIRTSLPGIKMQSKIGDYFEVIKDISKENTPNLFLFLGGNIGNYKKEDAFDLLQKFASGMKKGDKLLLGIDLQKSPRIIQKAYDDPHGITKAFNINLLHRINRELDADIDVSQFDFYCHYNPENGEVNSYLYSLTKQRFYSRVLNKSFTFQKDETIWTELSKKYSFIEIEELSEQLDFKVLENFLDSKQYFTDSLWEK
ncbi:dimethylhistidine N-methyltransferase [Flavobacterium gossypii]|uniref:Dimethylhistidine N-methyltransferase n=1 Tax=Flavobacterium gossypii TaxID=1646119 RepID=A0ABR6DNK8_9FLAO|nr:L-histidine N(alpha)-methyltransferase [Flavobacterium gossypii]MBA9073273.1 dimethylhistidine N-methyltransferase [Flavobacterium gossypii]